MSRCRMETYLDKVYGFSGLVAGLAEGRQFPQHSWQKVFSALFLGAAMQLPSLHQLEAECRSGSLAKRIGPISEDTFGYALQRQPPEPVFALGCDIARRLKRNGVLHSVWSRGLVVAAVDGIEICSSFARCCDACMERKVEHKVAGRMQSDIQYYHRIVAVTLVSTTFPVPLGIRFQKDGEGEVACALALLQDLVKQLGKRFIDLVVGDALYLQAPFVKAVEELGLDWAFTLKQNQPDLLREAGRLTAGTPDCIEPVPLGELSVWHVPQIDWPVADRLISVTKTVRVQRIRRIVVENTGDGKKKRKTPLAVESTNFYASNFELGCITPSFIHRLSRSRWRIDTELFQTLTTDCHLKRPSVHQSNALVLLTMIRLLAYTLTMVFFQLQFLSHARGDGGTFKNMAKRLAGQILVAAISSG